nr:unnamed protein product [Callosobruchus analis]
MTLQVTACSSFIPTLWMLQVGIFFCQMAIQQTFTFEFQITVCACEEIIITTCFRVFQQMRFGMFHRMSLQVSTHGSFKIAFCTFMYFAGNG